MSVNFRYPNITAPTEKEQLAQIKSFLRQLVNDLNYAFSVIEAGNAVAHNGAYEELKNTMVTEIQRLDSRINNLSNEEE